LYISNGDDNGGTLGVHFRAVLTKARPMRLHAMFGASSPIQSRKTAYAEIESELPVTAIPRPAPRVAPATTAGATVYCTGRSVRGQPSPYNRPETIDETTALINDAGGTAIAVRMDHTVESKVKALFRRIDRSTIASTFSSTASPAKT